MARNGGPTAALGEQNARKGLPRWTPSPTLLRESATSRVSPRALGSLGAPKAGLAGGYCTGAREWPRGTFCGAPPPTWLRAALRPRSRT